VMYLARIKIEYEDRAPSCACWLVIADGTGATHAGITAVQYSRWADLATKYPAPDSKTRGLKIYEIKCLGTVARTANSSL
jgi:hypothetical protein